MSTPAMPWTKYQAQPSEGQMPWEKYAQTQPGGQHFGLDVGALGAPKQESLMHSLAAIFGLTPEQADAEREQVKEHPLVSAIKASLGPAEPVIEGIGNEFMRSTGEAGRAVDALRGKGEFSEGKNPYAAVEHGAYALPFVGGGIQRGVEQMAPSATPGGSPQLTRASFGTALGTAAQMAPMVLGGIDSMAPGRPMLSGSAIRSAAIGDPDAAALRGMRVGPASPKALSTIRATQGARPFLHGAQSLEDVQARIPGAKSEIWGPYQKTIDAIGDKPVTGPDGPTTVRELEAERQQLSAINRQLKSRTPSPEAVKLAEQKGLNQAQALQRERAVQNALDPVLRDAGIQPKAIRQAFGQVSQIGERVSGKTTLAEPKQPYGFGKMANLSLEHPFQAPAQILSGVRDLAAGRPWWSGSPTDVSLREAFRPNIMKPDFGAFRPETHTKRCSTANAGGKHDWQRTLRSRALSGEHERNT